MSWLNEPIRLDVGTTWQDSAHDNRIISVDATHYVVRRQPITYAGLVKEQRLSHEAVERWYGDWLARGVGKRVGEGHGADTERARRFLPKERNLDDGRVK